MRVACVATSHWQQVERRRCGAAFAACAVASAARSKLRRASDAARDAMRLRHCELAFSALTNAHEARRALNHAMQRAKELERYRAMRAFTTRLWAVRAAAKAKAAEEEVPEEEAAELGQAAEETDAARAAVEAQVEVEVEANSTEDAPAAVEAAEEEAAAEAAAAEAAAAEARAAEEARELEERSAVPRLHRRGDAVAGASLDSQSMIDRHTELASESTGDTIATASPTTRPLSARANASPPLAASAAPATGACAPAAEETLEAAAEAAEEVADLPKLEQAMEAMPFFSSAALYEEIALSAPRVYRMNR